VIPDLAQILSDLGPPPLWSREPGFPTLVHIILEQQVSPASARRRSIDWRLLSRRLPRKGSWLRRYLAQSHRFQPPEDCLPRLLAESIQWGYEPGCTS
jgi:3-methyladenine DNA glycosylase/8-oxoguanine DNA glycosylase